METKKPQRSFLIDADGTLFTNNFPIIGNEIPHAVRVIKRIQKAGHILILNTMRHGDELEEAKAWLKDNDLKFHYFNCNPAGETGSRKVYGHYDIDDHNIGCPVIYNPETHHKPFVDWQEVEKILEQKKLI